MNYRRAIGIGVVNFAITLVANAIIAAYHNIDLKATQPSDLPAVMWQGAIITAFILSIVGSWWYFSAAKTEPNVTNGFKLGVIAIVVGFILDVVFLLPYKNGDKILVGYYHRIEYWGTLMLIMATCTGMGSILLRRRA